MLALIDGDIVAYRVSWASEDVDMNITLARVDEMMVHIFKETEAKTQKTFLTDSEGNFRQKLYPDYKLGRPKKPHWLSVVKEYLKTQYEAVVATGEEADDALGISQEEDDTIICSIDKDLLQIPGHHYNFVTKTRSFVTEAEGRRAFYTQLAQGDFGDNIPGIPGIGKAKAAKIIGDKESEETLFEAVYTAYRKYFDSIGVSQEEAEGIMLLWGQMLKIRTRKDELWSFPKR